MENKKATPKEKQLKYEQLLQQSGQEREQEEIKYEVEQAKLQLQSDINATEKQVSQCKKAVNVAKMNRPFNAKLVIDAQIELQGYEDGLKRLKELQEELF